MYDFGVNVSVKLNFSLELGRYVQDECEIGMHQTELISENICSDDMMILTALTTTLTMATMC